jgi:hypothetical protein
MKTIQLKKGTEKIIIGGNEQEITIDTKDLIRHSLNNVPKDGFDVSDMMARLRIMNELEKVNGSEMLELEDADFTKLASCVREMRWTVLSRGIVDFINSFN